MNRHILNFTHSGAHFRLYANYRGAKDGTQEVNELMALVESKLGPESSSPTAFMESVKEELRKREFELFKA